MILLLIMLIGTLIMSFSLFIMLLDTIFDKEIFDKLSKICVLLGAFITFPTMLIFSIILFFIV